MRIYSVCLISLIVLISACKSPKETAGSATPGADVPSAIKAKRYVFQARNAIPTGGRNRQLSSGYTLEVTGDTLVAYLPYFGRAYTAPIDPSKGGIQFTSVNFDYTEQERSKGGWNIRIKPTDNREVRDFYLTISANGYGTLQVNSINRQPISFTGIIEPAKSR